MIDVWYCIHGDSSTLNFFVVFIVMILCYWEDGGKLEEQIMEGRQYL